MSANIFKGQYISKEGMVEALDERKNIIPSSKAKRGAIYVSIETGDIVRNVGGNKYANSCGDVTYEVEVSLATKDEVKAFCHAEREAKALANA